MFNIDDYIRYPIFTSATVNVEIDKDKIAKDVEQLKDMLIALEKLIGPFKIKVIDGKVKLKTKDEI